MKRLTVLAALMCLAMVVAPAGAAEISDPDDVDGFLDLKSLSAEGDKGEAGSFTIKTWEGFACNYLKDGSKKTYLKLLFDDGRDGDVDLVGKFVCLDNKLFMVMHGPDSGSNYEPLRAKRPKAKVTKVEFQLDLLEFEASHMGVFVKSKDGTNTNCDPACKDRVPPNGSLKVY